MNDFFHDPYCGHGPGRYIDVEYDSLEDQAREDGYTDPDTQWPPEYEPDEEAEGVATEEPTAKQWTVVDSDRQYHIVEADYIGYSVAGAVNFFRKSWTNHLVASFHQPISVTEK